MTAKTEAALGLSFGAALGEDGWNTWMDDNLVKLGATAQISVVNKTTTTPPTLIDGNRYIVGTGATGAWASKDGQLAFAVDSQWVFYPLKKGWLVHDQSSDAVHLWNGTAFVEPSAAAIAAAVAAEAGTRAAADTALDGRVDALEAATNQAGIQFKDEGTNLGTSATVTTLDFTGAGVTATRVGNVVTVDVPNGGTASTLSYTDLEATEQTIGTGGIHATWSDFMTWQSQRQGSALRIKLLSDQSIVHAGLPYAVFSNWAYVEFDFNGFGLTGAGVGVGAVIAGSPVLGLALKGTGTLSSGDFELNNVMLPELVGGDLSLTVTGDIYLYTSNCRTGTSGRSWTITTTGDIQLKNFHISASGATSELHLSATGTISAYGYNSFDKLYVDQQLLVLGGAAHCLTSLTNTASGAITNLVGVYSGADFAADAIDCGTNGVTNIINLIKGSAYIPVAPTGTYTNKATVTVNTLTANGVVYS